MTSEELYQLGEEAYSKENYEEALKYYIQAGHENADAVSSIPFCYVSLATEVSMDASNHANDQEYLIRGQQKAVKLLDEAIRASLTIYRDFPNNVYACNIAAYNIANATNLQYSLTSTGLTTAYRITTTETNIMQHLWVTKINGEVVDKEVLWEDILGTETNTFISLNSYDMSQYHIIGPDEKTKRVKASMETIVRNTAQIAGVLECVNRECDAQLVRASLALAMAEADNGDRSMLLPAEWFLARAVELAKANITDTDAYNNWCEFYKLVAEDYTTLSKKYAALLKNYRKRGERPYLSKFYVEGEKVPAVESCESYMKVQEVKSAGDANSNGFGDLFEIFLTVFAQVSFMKIFPTILFASIISLFFGGLLSGGGAFDNIFTVIWFILTIGLTFFRTVANADEFRTNNTFKWYMGIMLGTAVLFSINFPLALIVYIVLTVLSKKYK